MPDLFAQVQSVLNTTPDARGYVHTTCPGCGRDKKHFAVFVKGDFMRGRCVACGHWMNQNAIVETYLKGVPLELRAAPVKVKRPTPGEPKWKAHADELQFHFSSATNIVQLWQAYKPLPVELILERGLGVGVIPASQCKHRRLTVPMYQNGKVISWRARAFECDCKSWLSPYGHPQVLFNGARLLPVEKRYQAAEYHVSDANSLFLLPSRGQVVTIVENAIDALWLTMQTPQSFLRGHGSWRTFQ